MDRFANFVIKLRTEEFFGKLLACKKHDTIFKWMKMWAWSCNQVPLYSEGLCFCVI